MIELHTPPTSAPLPEASLPGTAPGATSQSVRTALSSMGGIRTRSFAESLQQAETETDPEERADAEARATAQEFVAVTLVQPLLAQLRASNNAWGPFKPGAHEQQFGQMLDAEYAARITRSSGYGLVDRLARDLRRTTAPTTTNEPDTGIDTEA